MNRIDILAFIPDSIDTEIFIEDAISYSNNSIILLFDNENIKVGYKSPNVNFGKTIFKHYKYKKQSSNYLIMFLNFLSFCLLFTRLLTVICWKYRPKVCWIGNTHAATVVGILRKLNLTNKSIYVPGDWLASSRHKKFLSYIGSNLIFTICDYLACKFNDVVLNHTEQIAAARYKFWGRKIAKKEKLYLLNLKIKAKSNIEKKINNICFIGNLREDSGLAIIVKALSEIRKFQDIGLKIIGPKNHRSEDIRQLSIRYSVDQYVKILDFVETEQLAEILSDCFCGINLITSTNSYSSYTIPAKIINYLQHLLPVIVTEGVGPLASIIRDNKLGLVIEPSQEAFINSVFKIYNENKQYRKNIVCYINSLPKTNIKELIEG